MRISSAQIYGSGVTAMQEQQGRLLETQRQLATGKRILTPADDPAGAAQSLRLRERIAALDQYARNAQQAQTRLGYQETVLTGMGESLQRARELTVQAANGALSDESRAAIAVELRQISAGLLNAANAQDANGEYLFAGYQSRNRPFVMGPDGEVEYLGDAGRREIALSPERNVAVGETGLRLMRIPLGNGVFTVTPDALNQGTGRVAAAERAGAGTYAGELYTLRWDTDDTYEVLDENNDPVAAGAYQPGEAIDFGGLRVVLEGEPAAGDVFHVAPAGEGSPFATLDALATALETPAATPAEQALLVHRIGTALQDVDQALGRVLEMRSDVGARLNIVEASGLVGEDHLMQLKTSLSAVEDLDYAAAVSRFHMQQAALEAAQQTYVQLARLSLFNFLR